MNNREVIVGTAGEVTKYAVTEFIREYELGQPAGSNPEEDIVDFCRAVMHYVEQRGIIAVKPTLVIGSLVFSITIEDKREWLEITSNIHSLCVPLLLQRKVMPLTTRQKDDTRILVCLTS